MTYSRTFLTAFVLGLAPLPAAQDVVAGTDKDKDGQAILKRVFKDWQLRRERVRSLECLVEGTSFEPKGRVSRDPLLRAMLEAEDSSYNGQDVPGQDMHFDKKARWILDFGMNRSYREVHEHRLFDKRLVPEYFAAVFEAKMFDGENLAYFTPRRKNPAKKDNWDIIRAKRPDPTFFPFDYPVFWAAGYVPTVRTDVLPTRIALPFHPELFSVVGRTHREGRQHFALVAKSPRSTSLRDEFLVDPGRGSVIVEFSRYVHGRLDRRIRADYEQRDDGWLPTGWLDDDYGYGDSNLSQSNRVRVIRLELNVSYPKDIFQPRTEVGMFVLMDDLNYRVEADGSLSPVSDSKMKELIDSEGTIAPRGRVLLGLAIALACGVVVLLLRKTWIGKGLCSTSRKVLSGFRRTPP